MSAPVRERVLQAILTATGGVWGVDGPEDERDVPLTVVHDESDSGGVTAYGVTSLTMPLTLVRFEVAASQDRNAQRAQAHLAMASLVAAMYVDSTFGGLVSGVDYLGGSVAVGGQLVQATCSFRIGYRHARGDATLIPGV